MHTTPHRTALRYALLITGGLLAAPGPAAGENLSFVPVDNGGDWTWEYEPWLLAGTTARLANRDAHFERIWRPGTAYGDQEISFEMRIEPSETGFQRAGCLYRAQDAARYYWVSFDFRRKSAAWYRSDSRQAQARAGRGAECPQLQPGVWHSVRIVARGDRHSVFLDGEPILERTDPTYAQGPAGFFASQADAAFRNLAITGDAIPCEPPMPVQTLPFVEICTDGGTGGYEGFPSLIRSRTSGDLICAFYAGYKHVPSGPDERLPKGARINVVRSSDNGRTWSDPEVLCDSAVDDHDCTLTQLADGRIAVTICCWPSEGRHRPFICWSDDDGRTWTEPAPLQFPGNPMSGTLVPFRGKIHELPDGGLLLACYGDDPALEKRSSVGIFRSDDQGRTWHLGEGGLIRSPEKEGHDVGMWEPDLTRLPDGRLLLLARQKMWRSVSEDEGRTWSAPEALPLRGDAPFLLLTSRQVLLCGIRYRGVPRGTCVIFSRDFGQTWSDPVLIAPVIGAYTSLAELPDGRVFVAYYTESGPAQNGRGSDIRGAVLRITDVGIEVQRP